MIPELNYYQDEDGNEFIALITAPTFKEEVEDYGLKLIESVKLDGDFTSWPTDRLLEPEK